MADYPWQGKTAKYVVAEIDEIKSRMYQAESDNDTLRQQLAQAEARISELVEALTLTRDNMIDWSGYVEPYFLKKHDLSGDIALANKALGFNHLRKPPINPFILRKQAAALEGVANASRAMMNGNYIHVDDLHNKAKLLRQQASDLSLQAAEDKERSP